MGIHLNPDNIEFYRATNSEIYVDKTELIHFTNRYLDTEVFIPNQEVQKGFINCIEDGGWEPVMDAIRHSEELLTSTINADEELVAAMIEQAHQENISILKYNDENALSCVISLAYYCARKDYSIYRELAGGKGFADMVFVPHQHSDMPAIIVQLKWNKSADTAISQIKSRQYVESLKGYKGEVVLVGISYD